MIRRLLSALEDDGALLEIVLAAVEIFIEVDYPAALVHLGEQADEAELDQLRVSLLKLSCGIKHEAARIVLLELVLCVAEGHSYLFADEGRVGEQLVGAARNGKVVRLGGVEVQSERIGQGVSEDIEHYHGDDDSDRDCVAYPLSARDAASEAFKKFFHIFTASLLLTESAAVIDSDGEPQEDAAHAEIVDNRCELKIAVDKALESGEDGERVKDVSDSV